MCLKNHALGDVLQILNMLITIRKWIVHQQSGWQPLNIILTEVNFNSEVIACLILQKACSGNETIIEYINSHLDQEIRNYLNKSLFLMLFKGR